MISKLFFLFFGVIWVTTVSAYVVTWTGDDEAPVRTKRPEHLLGEKMCTRGPAYWCHNITQAKECHAVHHCIEKVWQGMTLPVDNDSVCQICKDMVKQARDQLMSNETVDELRQVLEGSCNLIPLKLIAKECRQLADEFIPELVDTLASRMDPQVVCAVSGLCNSARIDEMLGEMKPIEQGRPVDSSSVKKFDLKVESCPKCNFYLGKGIDFLKKLPENEVLDKLFEVCGRLGSFSDSCRVLVMQHIDTVYSHIQNDMNSEELCGLVGLCEVTSIRRVQLGKHSTAVRVWSPPSNDDDLPCEFCKQLVSHVKDWLVSNTTRDEFRDIVRGLCKQTGKFRKECLNLEQQYGKPLYQLLIDETDPDRICGQMGVCPTTGKFQLFGKQTEGPVWTILATDSDQDVDDLDVLPMTSLLPGERLTGDDERNAIKLEKKQREGIECQFCEFALDKLKSYIENPRREEQVREAVDKLCTDILTQEMAQQCTQFVSEYGDSLIVLIAEEIDSTVICPKLGLCKATLLTSSGNQAEVEEIKPIVKIDQRPKNMNVPSCPLCHFAVAKVINMIGENRTKVAIDRALDSVCYVLPKTVKSDCLNFMTYYGNQIGELVVIQLTAREVCMALGLCVIPYTSPVPSKNNIIGDRILPPTAVKPTKIVVDSALPLDRFMPQTMVQGEISKLEERYPGLHSLLRPTTTEAPKDEEKADEKCVICEFAITKIAEQLKNNATEEEIRETVERGCSYLPKSVSEQCKTFIDQYADLVITYLAQSVDPKQICEELGLCTQAKMKAMKALLAESLKRLEAINDVNMGRCQLCVVVSEYLSAMLEDPKVETSVDSIVEKICPIVPSKYRSECKEMVEDYGPYIMSLLAQATDKGHACNVLNLCPNSSE